jgi:hypothetical protein
MSKRVLMIVLATLESINPLSKKIEDFLFLFLLICYNRISSHIYHKRGGIRRC